MFDFSTRGTFPAKPSSLMMQALPEAGRPHCLTLRRLTAPKITEASAGTLTRPAADSCGCTAFCALRALIGPIFYIPSRVNGAAGQSLQQRIEDSVPGRALISLLIVFTLLAVVVINLPDSALRRSLSKTTQPYLNAIGLDQAWGVFAPDPRRESIRLEVRLGYPDGTDRGLEGARARRPLRRLQRLPLAQVRGEPDQRGGGGRLGRAAGALGDPRGAQALGGPHDRGGGERQVGPRPAGPDADKPAPTPRSSSLNLDVTPAMLKEPK